MRRIKRHHVKQERPETSSSASDIQHDLTYYIHDRVELMHQVFSVLKPKELKAMAPYCVKHISLSDLQELCMEELLGISSKRLCAILDGAEPPSDTETSSSSTPEKFETISLDSISSDEEILSESSSKKKKKKHKHHHCRSKSKSNKRRSSEASVENEDRSKASRAGLTVLELLELQARARAIRAQLQQVQPTDLADATASHTVENVSDGEVEIKEEPAEIVEISSEDEKPKIEDLQKGRTSENITENSNNETPTITKRVKDLIITVPVTKSNRKIKLNRTKPPVTVTADVNRSETTKVDKNTIDKERPNSEPKSTNKTSKNSGNEEKSNPKSLLIEVTKTVRGKQKKKPKKKEKGKVKNKQGSDNDEITLQLSDSEKIDLLENLDRKNYDVVSSTSTEDSESSSDSSDSDDKRSGKASIDESSKVSQSFSEIKINPEEEASTECHEVLEDNRNTEEQPENAEKRQEEKTLEKASENESKIEVDDTSRTEHQPSNDGEKDDEELTAIDNSEKEVKKCNSSKDKSEGEISDRESSEVEASEVQPQVVCISDEDMDNKKEHKKKKNKKKEKKAKKEKKSKKSQDFRKAADQNFYTESSSKNFTIISGDGNTGAPQQGACNDDDVYEILELSDESSCNGEDGNSVLSKEPTAEEIAALSAKVDELEREEVVTEAEIREHEKAEAENMANDAESISWKDRYLDSRKVKNVLSTANILNAMRKKNKELKRKLEDSKKESVIVIPQVAEEAETNLEEGSIEQYNTLEGSTKYIQPDVQDVEREKSETGEGKVSNEMKKDAKQLLKMYKKLLNYNDMNRKRDPNKKKKKKHKKSKEDNETDLPAEAKST